MSWRWFVKLVSQLDNIEKFTIAMKKIIQVDQHLCLAGGFLVCFTTFISVLDSELRGGAAGASGRLPTMASWREEVHSG
jgi:hypothetical protein